MPAGCSVDVAVPTGAGVGWAEAFADGTYAENTLDGTTLPSGTRLVQPIGYDPEDTDNTLRTLAITGDGLLHSVTHTLQRPGAPDQRWRSSDPVRIGHGWAGVRDIAIPSGPNADAPYMFAAVGQRINRYTVRTDNAGNLRVSGAPHAAVSGYGGLRQITWARTTTVRGVTADVLLGLDGARLIEYTVPRVQNPRVHQRVLATSGWGGVRQIHAGNCSFDRRTPLAMTPVMGVVGTTARLYVQDRRGAAPVMLNHGDLGAWPGRP